MRRLIVIVGCLAAVAGCATTPEARLFSAGTSAVESTRCIQSGTRIRLRQDECSSVSGRSYSQEEIERTGSFSLAEALRKLDPTLGF